MKNVIQRDRQTENVDKQKQARFRQCGDYICYIII